MSREALRRERDAAAKRRERAAAEKTKRNHETAKALLIPIVSAVTVMCGTLYVQSDKNRLDARRAVVDSFIASSSRYTAITHDVFSGSEKLRLMKEKGAARVKLAEKEGDPIALREEMKRWEQETRSIEAEHRETEARWKGEVVDGYHGDLLRLDLYFGAEVATQLARAKDSALFIKPYFDDGRPPADWVTSREALKKANEDLARRALESIGITRVTWALTTP